MDKSLLSDLQETIKALKVAIVSSQNGVAGLTNISTTRLYDRRQSRPEESLTFKVEY